MIITSTQKVIKVGSSAGLTLPAKELKRAGIKPGDEVDITLKKHHPNTPDEEVLAIARDILNRYKQDFKNLADR